MSPLPQSAFMAFSGTALALTERGSNEFLEIIIVSDEQHHNFYSAPSIIRVII
jgi:hypothetical protein